MRRFVLIAMVVLVVVVSMLWRTGSKEPDAPPVPNDPVADPVEPAEGLLGPAWSTTAPEPSQAPTVAPRPSKSPARATPPVRQVKPTSRATQNRPRVAGWLGAMQDCIARRESGRNPKAVDPTHTYWGMYQFDDRSFRIASGGLHGHASLYPAATQTAAFFVWFDNGRGRHRWTTYGWCQAEYGGPA